MARSAPARSASRSLIWLGVIVVALIAVLGLGGGGFWNPTTWIPKLALDLEGGTQVILAPQLATGQTPTQDQLDQSVSIIRERVDSAGVAEAEVGTQGGANVVVTMPGTIDETTMNRIKSSARLTFRPVLYTAAQTNSAATASPTPGATDSPTPGPTDTPAPVDTPTAVPTDASDLNWVTPALQQRFDDFDCSQLNDPSYVANAPDDQPYITCGESDGAKYILGPVEVTGDKITDASAGLMADSQGRQTNTWAVYITFNDEGTRQFDAVTTRLYGYLDTDTTRNRFAIVLDGRVIEAPTTQSVITNGKPQISGSFTQQSAQTLADQLKFGALPISFTVQSQDTISATLGKAQLLAGLLAGLIGMILVLIYSLFQYRLLGLVTMASLVLMGVLTYLAIAIFSWQNGYRLSLAGVAGLIVSIGFTADSFIVYFERIRDELRDGKSLTGAVSAGWKRALRTILSAKFINLLSAVVLYILAAGNVQGFAFTLGVTTVIDVIVVLLFTHPILQLLAENRFFASGHPLTGLDPSALGAVYRGRAEFRFSPEARRKGAGGKEAAKRQTIAERKASEAAGVNGSNGEEA